MLEELRAIRAELVALRAAVERSPSPPLADARHVRLLAALADAMGDLDLSFDAAEVLAHGRVDHGLAEALAACGLTSTSDVGALFRSLRGRDVDGLRLVRDGRTWRLQRCT